MQKLTYLNSAYSIVGQTKKESILAPDIHCTMSTKSSYAYLKTSQDVVFDERYIPEDLNKFEVLVKISACALNTNAESNELFGDFEDENGYRNLGADVSGIVHKVGSAVKSFRAGDLVAGVIPISYQQSGCGQHVLFDEYDLVKIPENLNQLDVAACIGDCIRAYIGLFYCAKVTKEDTVLVLNGAKPCSAVCAQLAGHIGAKVLTTCSTPSEKTFLESNSNLVDGVIDFGCDKSIANVLYNEVMKKTDNLGADIVLDLDSKERSKVKNGSLTVENIISCLTIHGRWVTCDDQLQLDPPDSQKLHGRCASLCFLHEQAWLMSKIAQGKYQHILKDAMQKLKSNIIRPQAYVNVSFESLPQVIRQLRKENNVNKIVVSIP